MSKLAPGWQRISVFEAVFDQLSDALILYDCEFTITGVNRSAETLIGKPAREMLGKHCKEVLGTVPESPAHQTFHLDRGNGVERLVAMLTGEIFGDGGQPAGVVATFRALGGASAPPQHTVIAESSAMLEILKLVRRIAASPTTTILLEGESGTGKDLIAKTLHHQSLRQDGPFIAVNCAAIPAALLESELFGYERGAFTDARVQKRGILELADRGTLFLDEVGELPLVLQAKLLRTLEGQTFRRLGGLADIQLDLRIVAATNKNLREAVKQKTFRQDLYFRLNVIQMTIPPLRNRPADVVPLAKFFVEHYNRKFKRHIQGLSGFAIHLLVSYDWPGNVRELRNAIEHAMILEESDKITSASLPVSLTRPGEQLPLMALHESERALVGRALHQTSGNQAQAARLLRVSRDRLRTKKRKLSLP